MADSRMMAMFLIWINRIPLEFGQDKDFDTLIKKFSCYTGYSYGWTDWRFIYGQLVS